MFGNKILHVAVPYVNPLRYRTRETLAKEFIQRMENVPNVRLYIGEVAFGDRDFVLTDPTKPNHFRYRTRHELWHKERVMNLLTSQFSPDWEYGAYIDADFTFSRDDWAMEAIDQLQHYDWVQLFSILQDVNDKHQPLKPMPSFAYQFHKNGCIPVPGYILPFQPPTKGTGYMPGKSGGKVTFAGATGAAWSFRRDSFDKLGGHLDTCALGSGDWHMAWGLVGGTDQRHPDISQCGKGYVDAIVRWQDRAKKHVDGNIGYIDNMAIHHWHGGRASRGYEWRWKILRDNDFDPITDMQPDWQGLWAFTGNKPRLRDAMRAYFRSRSEDMPHTAELIY